jgi:hypothetical protein
MKGFPPHLISLFFNIPRGMNKVYRLFSLDEDPWYWGTLIVAVRTLVLGWMMATPVLLMAILTMSGKVLSDVCWETNQKHIPVIRVSVVGALLFWRSAQCPA